jgi:hypothetical protein
MATTTTTTTPTGWAADAAYSNYQRAQQIAGQPFADYPNPTLAGWNQGQETGYNSVVNGGGVGLGAMGLGQQYATQAGAYQPQQVQGAGYQPFMQGVVNTGAASAGPATNAIAAQMQAASAGPSTNMLASQMQAANAGPAAMAQAANAGPAAQMQAAQMARGDVRNVAAQSFPGANLGAYMNPYISNVVNSTLGQLGRQNDIIQNTTNAKAAAAGAFGGSRQAVMNSENNRAFLDTAGQVTSNLYNQGFNTAQAAIGQDQNRAMQADLANQGQDWNVGSANLANRQNSALQNMMAGNQMSQFNAGLGQQTALANQSATNNRAEYNATNQQAASLNNANFLQSANAANAAAMNQMAQYNAGLQQAAGLQNSNLMQGANLANASAANQMAQYNAGLSQTALSQTAASHNAALASQAAARNAAGQFNSDLGLRAQLANQQAGLTNNATSLSAANALNGMGLDQQQQMLAAANAQFQMGQARTAQDQAAYNDVYNKWSQEQNYPLQQLGILQQGLNGYSSGTTQTTPYYSNTGAQITAGVLGAGALGAGILKNGTEIAQGAKSIWDAL